MDAEPPLTRMTIGRPLHIARFGVEALAFVRPTRSGRNDLALVQERIGNLHRLVSKPPGLFRRSKTTPFRLAGGFSLRRLIARSMLAVVCSLKEVIRT